MTFAWYAHLKDLKSKRLILAFAVSWGIALFEYISPPTASATAPSPSPS